MKVYKLSNEELEKAHNDFGKTFFGKRAKLLSMMPIVLAAIGIVFAFLFMIIDIVIGFIDPTDFYANTELIILAIFGVSAILLSLGCIAQLQYGRMLSDYINANSKK